MLIFHLEMGEVATFFLALAGLGEKCMNLRRGWAAQSRGAGRDREMGPEVPSVLLAEPPKMSGEKG